MADPHSASHAGGYPSAQTIAPKTLEAIVREIQENFSQPPDMNLQEITVNECLKYLTDPNAEPVTHWFCQSEDLTLVATTSLIAFAYDDEGLPILRQHRERLREVLQGCHKCAREYHIQLIKLRRLVLEDLQHGVEIADEILNCIEAWNVDRLTEILQQVSDKLDKIEGPKRPKHISEAFVPIFECLCAPKMLLNPENRTFFNLYKHVFFSVQTPQAPGIRPPELLPGLVSFLFGTDPEFYIFVRASLTKMAAKKQTTSESAFDTMLCMTVDDIVNDVHSNPRTQDQMRLFWYNFNLLLGVLEPSVLRMRLAGRESDILRFLANSILQSPQSSLPAVLLALGTVIDKLGPETWDVFAPIKVNALVMAIVRNPSFMNPNIWIPKPTTSELDFSQETRDSLSWINPLLQKSCDRSDLQKCSQQILPKIMELATLFKSKQEEELIFNQALDILLFCLKFEPRSSRLPFLFQVERLVKQDMKILCYRYANQILDACTRFKDIDLDACRKTYDIIYYSISLDVISGTPESQALRNSNAYEGEIPPANVKSLWTLLNDAFPVNSDIAVPVLKALKHATFIARPPPKRPEEVPVLPKGELSQIAIRNTAESMRLIGLYDSDKLLPVLRDRSALLAIFLNMFSADDNVNQSAVDVLCQALDADDRLSALTNILNFDFKSVLVVITEAIDWVNGISIFAPCPKLIKVAQDLSQCLFGASFGVFTKRKDELAVGSDNEFLKYWVRLWLFLERTFAKSPKWSSAFTKEFMTEFLRDLIDFSGGLVEYFSLVESLIPPLTTQQLEKLQEEAAAKTAAAKAASGSTAVEEKRYKAPKTISGLLLEPVILCLIQMCDCLRLKDESLIRSTFKVIMDVLELMKRFNISPSDELVEVFTNLAGNASRFENNLSNDQKTGLLVASGAFTLEEAERVLGGRATPESDNDIVEVRRSVSPTKTTRTDASGKQMSLLDFARPGVQQPPRNLQLSSNFSTNSYTVGLSAPKSSKLDAIRHSLGPKKTTLSSSGPKRDIHPARPPGFNPNSMFAQKSAAKANRSSPTKSGHSSSEDESEGEDNEDGLFAVKAQQPHKLRNIEKKSSGTHGVYSRTPVSRNALSEKEQEERNMRARLQVDMAPLYKKILAWDYHSNSNFPAAHFEANPSSDQYTAVPSTFSNVAEYVKVFEPLLMLECWQGIVKMKEEGTEQPFKVIIGSRTLVGNGVYEIRLSVPSKAFQQTRVGDSDLILLSYSPLPSVEPIPPSKDIPYCFAKVKEVKNSGPENTEISVRVDDPPPKMHTALTLNTEIHVLRVTSLTTIEREYAALKGLAYYNLKEDVLSAEPAESIEPRTDAISRAISTYNVNESQARAIICATNTNGVSLIQGPPGTGKTKTILGVIGSFLTAPRAGAPPPANSTALQASSGPHGNRPQPQGSTNDKDIRRIIICAPSNAAVDELVLRLRDGIQSYDGRIFKPSVVRLGRSDAVNSNVQEFTLEELVDKKLESVDNKSNNVYDGKLRETQNEQLAEREGLRKTLNNCQSTQESDILKAKIADLTRKIKTTGHDLDRQRENVKVNIRRRDIERRRFQNEIIRGSNVVCTTLSGSAHQVLLSLGMYFETVVIDEAAQSVELSSLIPLKYGCKQCIMVGDPNQLPPTVLSLEAAKFKYNESLFVRMFNKFPSRVHMLNVQFRMHPEISQFPSREFYRDKLLDGPENHLKTRREWHASDVFGPYRFFDVPGSHEQSKTTKSLFNRNEANATFKLYCLLERHFGREFLAGKIGIISPYKQQVNVIKKTFINELGNYILKDIDFNTIDGFQGQEKDIIIMSCVRAQPDARGVGFLGDTRRMNVAITRARSSLWILGNEKSLVGNPVWKRLLDDTKQRGLFTRITGKFFENEAMNQGLKSAAAVAVKNKANGSTSRPSNRTSRPSTAVSSAPTPAGTPIIGGLLEQTKKPVAPVPARSLPPRPSYTAPAMPVAAPAEGSTRRDSDDYEPVYSRKRSPPQGEAYADSYAGKRPRAEDPRLRDERRSSREDSRWSSRDYRGSENGNYYNGAEQASSYNQQRRSVGDSYRPSSGAVASSRPPDVPDGTPAAKRPYADPYGPNPRPSESSRLPAAAPPASSAQNPQDSSAASSLAARKTVVVPRRRPPSVFVKRPPGKR